MSESDKNLPFLDVVQEFALLEGGCDQGAVNLHRKSKDSLLAGVRVANILWADNVDIHNQVSVTRYEKVADAFLTELGRRAMHEGLKVRRPTSR